MLGGHVDMGGAGKCLVTTLEMDPVTGVVFFTMESVNTGDIRQFALRGDGSGELA